MSLLSNPSRMAGAAQSLRLSVVPTRTGLLCHLRNAIEAWLLREDIRWLDRVIEAYEADGRVDPLAIRALRDQRAQAMCRLALVS